LLFDENLSAKLLGHLHDLFPGSENALLNGLQKQTDSAIWSYAKSNNFMIVTTDRDFTAMLQHLGTLQK
jgi:predicted nuclease of predicted toxin-antitoxin system